jgi:hypothetical protein
MANPVPPNPTPKSRFQESSDNVKKHRDLLDQPELQRGLDFSLLEYQRMLTVSVNPTATTFTQESIAAANRLAGAQEFIAVLKTLAEPPPVKNPQPSPNLIHS